MGKKSKSSDPQVTEQGRDEGAGGRKPSGSWVKTDKQFKELVDAARAAGSDEDEAAFKERIGRIARQKPNLTKKS